MLANGNVVKKRHPATRRDSARCVNCRNAAWAMAFHQGVPDGALLTSNTRHLTLHDESATAAGDLVADVRLAQNVGTMLRASDMPGRTDKTTTGRFGKGWAADQPGHGEQMLELLRTVRGLVMPRCAAEGRLAAVVSFQATPQDIGA